MSSRLPRVIVGALLGISGVSGQEGFSGGIRIHSGQGTGQTSGLYSMSGSYALKWELTSAPPDLQDYDCWKPFSPASWQYHDWLSVTVFDVTRAFICSNMGDLHSNGLAVPSGGKHFLFISGPPNLAWTIWGKEGDLVAAGHGGQRVALPLTAQAF